MLLLIIAEDAVALVPCTPEAPQGQTGGTGKCEVRRKSKVHQRHAGETSVIGYVRFAVVRSSDPLWRLHSGSHHCWFSFQLCSRMTSAMKDLSASRRASVNELCSFVGATHVESIALLSRFNWNVAVSLANPPPPISYVHDHDTVWH